MSYPLAEFKTELAEGIKECLYLLLLTGGTELRLEPENKDWNSANRGWVASDRMLLAFLELQGKKPVESFLFFSQLVLLHSIAAIYYK